MYFGYNSLSTTPNIVPTQNPSIIQIPDSHSKAFVILTIKYPTEKNTGTKNIFTLNLFNPFLSIDEFLLSLSNISECFVIFF